MNHGRYREAVEGLQVVLEHAIQVYGQKHTHTFRTIRHLADALVRQGQYHKAHDMLSRVFNDRKYVADLEMLYILHLMQESSFVHMPSKKDKKRKVTVKEYLDDIKINHLSGGRWAPPKTWNRVHGNGKSSSEGQFHIETMKDSTGRYIAKIVGTADESVVVIDDGNSENEPSFAEIISALQRKYD
ncbi:MAG: hypothetical protein LQ351_006404 [Letrouitia transgressa]|nr:MAG: hypothetical protein LQ351_006404 [Letrouitia transgressa]